MAGEDASESVPWYEALLDAWLDGLAEQQDAAARQAAEDAYFSAEANGMCPYCFGGNTSATYNSHGTTAARWCYDCEEEFITEH